MRYVFEYNKNDDPIFGSCTEEKCVISEGDLCIGVVSETEGKDIQLKHWACVTPAFLNEIKLAVTEPTQIKGWDELKSEDKEKIQNAWKGGLATDKKPDNEDDVLTAELKADEPANQNPADVCVPVQPEITSDKNPSHTNQVQTVVSNTEETITKTQDTNKNLGDKNSTDIIESKTELFSKEVETESDVVDKQEGVEPKNEEGTNAINENSSVVFEKIEDKNGLNESSTEISKMELETSATNGDTSTSTNIEITRSSKKRNASTMEETNTVQEKKTVVNGRTSGKSRHIKPVRKPTRRSPRFAVGDDTKNKDITPPIDKKRKITENTEAI